jgi:AcrR family transcriptional regulator
MRASAVRRRVSGSSGRPETVLLERPYREITVDLVMAQAGLSRTVFYRHLDDMPDVLLTLLRMIEGELASARLVF